MLKHVVKAAAYLELIAGAIFILWPGMACTLVFGASPENIGSALARWVGIGLFALGIACLPSKIANPQDRAVLGLLSLNIGIVALLACVGMRAATHGLLLWPAVVLHFLVSVALLSGLLLRSRTA
jgi:hypothetical protein